MVTGEQESNRKPKSTYNSSKYELHEFGYLLAFDVHLLQKEFYSCKVNHSE